MVEVRLHGALAAEFGSVWHLDVSTAQEAVHAIDCGRPGFRSAIMDLDRAGMVFRVTANKYDLGGEDIGCSLKAGSRLDILPIIRGASAAVRFVVGAVLVVLSGALTVASFGALTPMGAAMFSVGVGLMLGSVVEWLTPTPKKDDVKRLDSWTMSGPANNADQGAAVPVIFGEVLVGATPVSAGVTVDASSISYTGVSCEIGGNLELIAMLGDAGTYVHVFELAAGVSGRIRPESYNWEASGFTNASAVRVINFDKAVVRIEVEYQVTQGASVGDTGTVTLEVFGWVDDNGSGGQYDQTLSATAQAITYARVS